MKVEIKNLICDTGSTLKDVMSMMDAQGQGVVFIVGERDEMVGLLTDGDIRRALLAAAELSDSVVQYMRKDFVFGSSKNSREENGELLNERIRHLPVCDKDQVIGIVTIGDVVKSVIADQKFTIELLEKFVTGKGYGMT